MLRKPLDLDSMNMDPNHYFLRPIYLKLEVMFYMVSASRSPRADSFSLLSSMDLERSIR